MTHTAYAVFRFIDVQGQGKVQLGAGKSLGDDRDHLRNGSEKHEIPPRALPEAGLRERKTRRGWSVGSEGGRVWPSVARSCAP